MNIFALDENPVQAAQYMCDKHIPKMVVETMQMLGSAVIRHGAEPHDMPLTSKGTPLKGGYHNHPCTKWAGDCRANYLWLVIHGLELLTQYIIRYDKTHACKDAIVWLGDMSDYIPIEGKSEHTPFVQAMPELYYKADSVAAYREYYCKEKGRFARWERGVPAPHWFPGNLCDSEAPEYNMYTQSLDEYEDMLADVDATVE